LYTVALNFKVWPDSSAPVPGDTLTLIVPDLSMMIEKLEVALLEPASVTVMLTGNVPELDGTPVMLPVAAFRLKPPGKPLPEKEYGVVPPVTVKTVL
jgi:hypothetical protein